MFPLSFTSLIFSLVIRFDLDDEDHDQGPDDEDDAPQHATQGEEGGEGGDEHSWAIFPHHPGVFILRVINVFQHIVSLEVALYLKV